MYPSMSCKHLSGVTLLSLAIVSIAVLVLLDSIFGIASTAAVLAR